MKTCKTNGNEKLVYVKQRTSQITTTTFLLKLKVARHRSQAIFLLITGNLSWFINCKVPVWENLWSKTRTNNKLNPHMTVSPRDWTWATIVGRQHTNHYAIWPFVELSIFDNVGKLSGQWELTTFSSWRTETKKNVFEESELTNWCKE